MTRLMTDEKWERSSALIRLSVNIKRVTIMICVLGQLFPVRAGAVVGQAEEYDAFDQADLENFHSELTREEQRNAEMQKTMQEMQASLQTRAAGEQALGEDGARGKSSPEAAKSEVKYLEKLQKEFLGVVKKDRIHGGIEQQYTNDSNILRLRPREGKGDSVIDSRAFVEFDAGGKKTDLRFETRGGKQWNIHFPEKDFWNVEERLRYRRRYFKKINHSVQSRLARTSSKTIEIDEKKVRWDSYQNSVFNYALTRKLSINNEINWNKRLFTTEPFDQDSMWEVTVAPSAFWNFTPKSRVSAGYVIGTNRIRSKIGNSNVHEVHASYFGQLTRKSSISFDAAFSHQVPKAIETPRSNTVTFGTGLIYQWTAKTQVALQFIRSQQNSTSNLVSATENETTKADSHFSNDSVSISINSRLMKKVNATLNLNATHFRNTVPAGDEEDAETRQFTFPVSLTIDYLIKRWLRFRLTYGFAFRTGDEKNDTYRSHQWVAGMNLLF